MKLSKEQQRKKRHNKIRSRITGTAAKPRLCVFRSLNQIYAQLIDDSKNITIVASDTLKIKKGTSVEKAAKVGSDIAKKALAKKVKTCVFDRGGYIYHGRVKALAEAARSGGLQF